MLVDGGLEKSLQMVCFSWRMMRELQRQYGDYKREASAEDCRERLHVPRSATASSDKLTDLNDTLTTFPLLCPHDMQHDITP